MVLTKSFQAKNREECRDWLEINHAIETEVWSIFYIGHTKRQNKSVKKTISNNNIKISATHDK